jgi:nucleoside-diphosphate-sugar epimerase
LTPSPVLITGASGFLGGALALRLAAQGVAVRALVRNLAKAAHLRAKNGISVVQGDLTDPASLRETANGCGVVFHCAALLGGHIDGQRRANVEGTRNLIDAAAEGGVGRFVHVSTLSVYGVHYRGQITEDMAHAPASDPYAITKSQAEGVVRAVAAERGINYTIMRPGMIYGARAGLWTGTLFRLASLKPTPWFGDGGGLAHCIHVDDALDMLTILAEHPNAVGEAFNCSNDPAPTWRAFLGEYARLARGVNDHLLELPPPLLYAVAGVVMMVSPPYSRGRMLPDYARFTQARAQFSMAKARRLLGWQPQVGVEEGVARCADWLRTVGYLK